MAAIAGGLVEQGNAAWAAARDLIGWRCCRRRFAGRYGLRRACGLRQLFIDGKSMGGRVASLLVDGLAALQTPTLVLQGERDSFGRRDEVHTYALSAQVLVCWIPSGDHSFKPTKSSGLGEAQNWATAVAYGDGFLRQLSP